MENQRPFIVRIATIGLGVSLLFFVAAGVVAGFNLEKFKAAEIESLKEIEGDHTYLGEVLFHANLGKFAEAHQMSLWLSVGGLMLLMSSLFLILLGLGSLGRALQLFRIEGIQRILLILVLGLVFIPQFSYQTEQMLLGCLVAIAGILVGSALVKRGQKSEGS